MTEFAIPSVILVDFNYPHSDFETQNVNMLAFMEALGASREVTESEGMISKSFNHADYTGHVAIHYSELEHPVYAGAFRLIIPNIGNVDIGILKSANEKPPLPEHNRTFNYTAPYGNDCPDCDDGA